MPVWSGAVLRCLQGAGVDNLQVFHALLRNAAGREWRDYFAVNVLGAVACMAKSSEASHIAERPSGAAFVKVHKLVINPARAAGLELFRLADPRGVIDAPTPAGCVEKECATARVGHLGKARGARAGIVMELTLEVVSPNGQALGPARRKVFGPEGGRIGRAPDCEWVIANPYISRHHATVRWISGTYYIESTGENGVAVNSPQALLPQRERRALRNGDRITSTNTRLPLGSRWRKRLCRRPDEFRAGR